MKKRIISILLSLATIIGMSALSFSASAEQITSGDYTYELRNDGTIEITDYNGKETAITVPEIIDGKTVTSIAHSAFSFCSDLVSVSLPSGITSIQQGLFFLCENLEQITIPDGVTDIGDAAFYGCSSLESIVIPDSVTAIAEEAFSSCISLNSVTLSSSLTSINDGAFSGCESLESVNIPSSVKSIGYYAFSECHSLSSIAFETDSKLEHVEYDAFNNTGVYNNEENWENGVLYIGNCLYSGVYQPYYNEDFDSDIFAKGNITVKDGTKVIASGAFSGCKELTGVTLPNSVTHIGACAFYECRSLEYANISNSVKFIGESAFAGCESMLNVVVPDSVTEIGDYALGYTYDCIRYSPDFRIICGENSAAEKYAIENDMNYTTATAYEYGDANYDGTINMLDVLLIRKYIAKQPVELDADIADVDCNGTVNMLDVLLIRKYIAKQPVTLGPKG